jgi:hypothetical protein
VTSVGRRLGIPRFVGLWSVLNATSPPRGARNKLAARTIPHT